MRRAEGGRVGRWDLSLFPAKPIPRKPAPRVSFASRAQFINASNPKTPRPWRSPASCPALPSFPETETAQRGWRRTERGDEISDVRAPARPRPFITDVTRARPAPGATYIRAKPPDSTPRAPFVVNAIVLLYGYYTPHLRTQVVTLYHPISHILRAGMRVRKYAVWGEGREHYKKKKNTLTNK